MTAIARRSIRDKIPAATTLASADDLDGTVDGTQNLDVAGANRVLIVQHNNGTAGTAGIDVVEISHDGGSQWSLATDVLALASDDATGTVLAGAALNAAGVEPVNMAIFKCGPYNGPTLLRIARGGVGAGGTAWVTGAPSVLGITIGK